MSLFSRFISRFFAGISIVGTLLAIVTGYYSVLLFKNLRTNFEELLPTTAPSVVDLHAVTDRLEALDTMAVLLFSSDTKASKKFADDLANELSKFPKDTIAAVEYRIDREIQFFFSRRSLYMELDDLTKIRNYISDRIEYEKKLYNPLNIFSEEEIPEPRLNFEALQKKYDRKASEFSRFPGGYYATSDEKLRTLLLYLPGKLSGIDAAHRMRKAVDDSIAKLRPVSYAPDLTIKFSGGVQNMIEEGAALVADLVLATVICLLLTVLVMYIYFRSLLGCMALIASLLIGTAWTFGVSYFLVGSLNANSAFLGAIVIGNGINYGIIFLARYLEEREANRGHWRALNSAISETMTSTWAAALAAGLAYGSLMLTSFRGFSQFGVIGLVGMVLCWISAFTMLPAFLTLLDRIYPLHHPGKKPPKRIFTSAMAWLVERHAGKIWITTVAAIVASLATFVKYSPDKVLENDLSKLRDKHSMESGSGYNNRYLEAIFGREISPVVVLMPTREEARQVFHLLQRKIATDGPNSLATGVRSMEEFLPADQQEKIKTLNQIRRMLFPRIYHQLDQKHREKADSLLKPEAFSPVLPETLPKMIRSKFTERDGSIGKLVLIEPQINSNRWSGNTLNQFIDGIREIADSVNPKSLVAGALPVTSDMIKAVIQDGPKATIMAFFAVIILVVLLFRKIRVITLALFTLLVGIVWLAGCVLGFEFKINFLNFIALPITFGIGVDYGVNMLQRYRIEGRGSILKCLRSTGGAVGLASITTMIGYGSLIIASNQAFVSFGVLAVLGEITCIVGALISLPAFLHYYDTKKLKAQGLTPENAV